MNLEQIPLKYDIKLDVKKAETKRQIIERVQNLKVDINKYKLDVQFLNLICNLIEYLVCKKDKIDKCELCLEILNDLFGCSFTEEEKQIIKNNINYMCNNKQVKTLSYYKLFKTSFLEFFKKK